QDLILDTGATDSLRMLGWYDVEPAARPSVKLQLISDEAQVYDMNAAAAAFDLELASNPELGPWHPAWVDFELTHSADQAIGGDLAVTYAKNGYVDSRIDLLADP